MNQSPRYWWLLSLCVLPLLSACDKTRRDTNLAPVIQSLTATPVGPVVAPGTQVQLDLAFVDRDESDPRPDSFTITWSIVELGVTTQPPNLAATLLVDDDTPGFWRAPDDEGVFRITGQVCDRFEACAETSLTLTVEQPNRPPRITASSVSKFNPDRDEPITITATAVDDDGDEITWEWTSTKGSFITRGPGEAVWVGTEIGNATITLRVTDPDNAADTESFVITID